MKHALIYLASPYSNLDPAVVNWRAAEAVRAMAHLWKKGYKVFSPIAHTHELPKYHPFTHEQYMEQDYVVLDRCDQLIVLCLPGWEESKGVALEVNRALAAGKGIYYMNSGNYYISSTPFQTPKGERLCPLASPTHKDVEEWNTKTAAEIALVMQGVSGLTAKHFDVKPTNPKDAIGDTKLPLHLISPIVKAYEAVAHFLGNVKYGAWNWRPNGARASIYKAALERHVDSWWEGEKYDPTDGTPHLANAKACINILIECEETGVLTDDRPPSRHQDYRRVRNEMETIMAKIREQYKDKKPRHYTITDTQLKIEQS